MKILVTGGAGFIGSNFILYWLNKYPNDEIINLDLLTYAACLKNLDQVKENPNYHFVQGDIRDSSLVGELVKKVEIIVHFAAESHVDRSIMSPSQFVETNVSGTQTLLEQALKNKIKHFHHISTDEVFGSLSLDSKDKFNERTNYDPRSPYSASKAGADFIVRAYYHTYGLPITISNCSNNYGPYQHPEKLIPLVITNLLEGKKVPIYGDGLNIRDWLYVEDHCRAIDLILSKGKIGETYCVGGLNKDISNLEVVNKIISILKMPQNQIIYVKDRMGHDRRYAIDWSKIKKELNWRPLFDFDNWLTKTITWYKNNSSWWKEKKDKNFQEYYSQNYKNL